MSLDLSKGSSYRKNYVGKRQYQHEKDHTIRYDQISNKGANMSAVVESSSYGKAFAKDQPYEKPRKERPIDELKFKGPTTNFSGYGEDYPSFTKNASPYVLL